MHDIVNDIALCIVIAWVLAMVAQVLRQPLILAYLLAGYFAGPAGVGWVKDQDSIHNISSLGLLFLLFMIGLEIDLKKMLSAGRVITITALVQILGGFALGLGLFWGAGFPLGGGRLDALYLGVAAAMSSTVIVVKILYDKRELDTLAGRITLGVLVLQDLFAILFLAIQPDLKHPAASLLLLSLGKVCVLVALAFAASRYGLPQVFRTVARVPELVLVGALAWCFLLANLAGWLGLSREMGALVAGVALSTFPYTLDVTGKVTGLRDFFVTLFFVALGMAIPKPSLHQIGWAAVLALFLIASRLLTVFTPLYRLKHGHRASFLPALNLAQMSEFSLVIVAIGASGRFQHVSGDTEAIAAYAFAMLAVGSTWCIVHSEGILRRISPRLARFGWPDLYHASETAAEERIQPKVFLLGFFWTASSLLEEITRNHPALLPELAVIDFNPHVNQRLRERGVNVIYGDVTQRETLIHAGVGKAEVILATIPNSLLKGASNVRLLRQLREINPHAKIIMHAEVLTELRELYAAGADYVSLPRLDQAEELSGVIAAARNRILDQKRAAQEQRLKDRKEVLD